MRLFGFGVHTLLMETRGLIPPREEVTGMVWSDHFNITKLKTSKGNSGCVPPAEERCPLTACEPNLGRVSQLGRPAKFWVCSTALLSFIFIKILPHH